MKRSLLVPATRTALALPARATATCPAGHWMSPQLGQVTVLDHAAGVLAAAGGQVCCLWNTTSHEPLRRIVEPAAIRSLSLSRDGKRLAVASGSRVCVYQLDSAERMLEYAHRGAVTSVHIGQSGRILASADVLGHIRVHELATGELRFRTRHQRDDLVVFVDPRDRVLTAESSTDVVFLDLITGRRVRSFSHDAEPASVPVPGLSGQLLIANSGNCVRLFDCSEPAGDTCFRKLEFTSRVLSIDICEDQSLFLVATADRFIELFDYETAQRVARYHSFTVPLTTAKFSTGRNLHVAGGEGLVMHLVDGRHVRSYYDERPPIVAATLTPQRDALLVSNRDGGVAHYDLRTGRRSDRFSGHRGSVSVVACSEDFVASGAYDGTCRVRRQDGALVGCLDLKAGAIQAIALDQERVWVGAVSGTVVCFDLETLQHSGAWSGHTASVRSLAVTRDGQYLLSGDENGLILLRDVSGTLVTRITATGTVYRCCFDSDGTLLATTQRGVGRFDPRSGQQLALYASQGARWFCLLDDGRLCSLELEGTLRIFDAAAVEVRRVQIADARCHRVVVALGPDRILTGSADGIVRCFDYELRQVAELHHLRQGVLWSTSSTAAHPGWLFTDRAELLDIGMATPEAHTPWPATDTRRLRHLSLYNSATHVMQAVSGRPLADHQSLTASRHPMSSGLGVPRLTAVP